MTTTLKTPIARPWKMEPQGAWSDVRQQEWLALGGMGKPAGRVIADEIFAKGSLEEVMGFMDTMETTWFWQNEQIRGLHERLRKEYGENPTEWNLLLDKVWHLNFGSQMIGLRGMAQSLKKLGRETSEDKLGALMIAHEIEFFKAAPMLQEFFLPEVKAINGRRAFNALWRLPVKKQIGALLRAKWPEQEIQNYVEEVWNDFSGQASFAGRGVLLFGIEQNWLSDKPRKEFVEWVTRAMALSPDRMRDVSLLSRVWPFAKAIEIRQVYELVKGQPHIVGYLAENPHISLRLMRQILKEVPAPGVRVAAAKRADCLADQDIRKQLMEGGRNKAIWKALLQTATDPGEISRLAGYLGAKDPKALQEVIASGVLGQQVAVPKSTLAKMLGSTDKETRVGAAAILASIVKSEQAEAPLPAQARPVRPKKTR